MCLAVPGRITDVHDDWGTPMATVDFGGVTREICLALLPELAVGDYAIVHVGFAISQIDEQVAKETLAMFAELDLLDAELGGEVPEAPSP